MTGSFTQRTGRSGYTFTHNVDEKALRAKINEFGQFYADIAKEYRAEEQAIIEKKLADPEFREKLKKREISLDEEGREIRYQAERIARRFVDIKFPEHAPCHQFAHFLGEFGYALDTRSLEKKKKKNDRYEIIELLDELKGFEQRLKKLPTENRACKFFGIGKPNNLCEQIALVLISKGVESQKAAFFSASPSIA